MIAQDIDKVQVVVHDNCAGAGAVCLPQMSGFGAFILVLILLILQFIAFIWVSRMLALGLCGAVNIMQA